MAFACEYLVQEVCNPQQAKKVLEANAEVSTALPCRSSFYQEGDHATLATLRPTALLEMFQSPGLRAVAEEVEETLVTMMQEATEQQAEKRA